MMTILDKIIKNKRLEIKKLKIKIPLSVLKKEIPLSFKNDHPFLSALKRKKGMAIVAEIKKKSPSKGILRKNFDPVGIARAYERGGASALSVLTDRRFFGGSGEILKEVKRATRLPILRKDFILDEYQVWESKNLGADAVLLIATVLPQNQLRRLMRVARGLGLEVLVEVHSKKDMDKIRSLKPDLVGINNRDLRSFKVDVSVTERLAKIVPKKCLLISESGIQTPRDLQRVKRAGAKAVLIGETLLKEKNLEKALRRFCG